QVMEHVRVVVGGLLRVRSWRQQRHCNRQHDRPHETPHGHGPPCPLLPKGRLDSAPVTWLPIPRVVLPTVPRGPDRAPPTLVPECCAGPVPRLAPMALFTVASMPDAGRTCERACPEEIA